MRTFRQAVRRTVRGPATPPSCVGHHWHYQSPFTHGLTLRGSGWKCCNCPAFVSASGAGPEHDGRSSCAELAGESERLDRVERWLDALQSA